MGNTHLLITKLSMCEWPTIRSKEFLTFMRLKPLYRNGKISGSILSRKKALFSQCYSVYGNQVKIYYLLTATHICSMMYHVIANWPSESMMFDKWSLLK